MLSHLSCGYSTPVLGEDAWPEQRVQFEIRMKYLVACTTWARRASCYHVIMDFKALAIPGTCGGARQFQTNLETKLKLWMTDKDFSGFLFPKNIKNVMFFSFKSCSLTWSGFLDSWFVCNLEWEQQQTHLKLFLFAEMWDIQKHIPSVFFTSTLFSAQ